MVWGIFPYRPDMSFESHLMGLLVGAVLAVNYRHEGPQPTVFAKDLEEEEDDTEPGYADNENSEKRIDKN
jgi:hypothetical protein